MPAAATLALKSPPPTGIDMEFDTLTTAVVFVVLIALGVVGTLQTPMTTDSVLMMVLPAMVVYGLVVLAIGVKHGEYRAGRS